MATQVQIRRGTQAENDAFTGAQGELTYDTTNKRIRIHDGATAGGFEAMSSDNVSITSGSIDGTIIGGTTAAAITGTTITGTNFVSSGNMSFGDNDKAIFGAGSDLQIYHDGSNSRIVDGGTGSLVIQATNFGLNSADNSDNFLTTSENAGVTVYYNGAAKLATTSTGIDVTGTVTADGLTVDGVSTFTSNVFISHNATPLLRLEDTDTALDFDLLTAGSNATIRTKNGAYPLLLQTNELNRVLVSGGGNISFYEDTGTTAKFFWDASAESLGLGTTAPNVMLHLESSTDSPAIRLKNTATGGSDYYIQSYVSGGVDRFRIGETGGAGEVFTIADGNVGIGTSSPQRTLHVHDDSTYIQLTNDTTGTASGDGFRMGYYTGQTVFTMNQQENDAFTFNTNNTERMRITSSGSVGIGTASPTHQLTLSDGTYNMFFNSTQFGSALGSYSSVPLQFFTNNAERMRIDSSGNLLVGTTDTTVYNNSSNTSADNGFQVSPNGWTAMSAYQQIPAFINRTGNDGDLISFTRSGTTVGSIASENGYTKIVSGNGTAGSGLGFYNYKVSPVNPNGNVSDNVIDLGDSDQRFKDLYLSGEAYLGSRLLLNTGGGSTYAENRFQVNADSGQYAAYFRKTNTDDEILTGFRHAGASGSTLRTLLYFQNGSGGTVGTIQANGSSTYYNTSSDYRLKEDVQPMTGASDRVLALKPCNFAWKDGGHRADGFLAHEAQEVVPEAVTGTKDAMRTEEYEVTPAVYDEDGNVVTEAVMGTREVPAYQGIDQSKLVPLLTAALQEALKRIEALEAKL